MPAVRCEAARKKNIHRVSGNASPGRLGNMKNSATETFNRYLTAFSEGPAGIESAAALLDDAFHFDGPMLQAETKREFLQGLQAMGAMQPSFKMLRQFADGDHVCSVYEFSAGGPAVVMADWAEIKAGKIVRQKLIYDSVKMKPPQ